MSSSFPVFLGALLTLEAHEHVAIHPADRLLAGVAHVVIETRATLVHPADTAAALSHVTGWALLDTGGATLAGATDLLRLGLPLRAVLGAGRQSVSDLVQDGVEHLADVIECYVVAAQADGLAAVLADTVARLGVVELETPTQLQETVIIHPG